MVYLSENIRASVIPGKEVSKPFKITLQTTLRGNGQPEDLSLEHRMDKAQLEAFISQLNQLKSDYITPPKNVFEINDYLQLRLVGRKTHIYVSGKLFRSCTYLFINIPKDRIEDYDEIRSIDEADAFNQISDELHGNSYKYEIDPEEEFRGHCSNMQAWYENDYNTAILHRSLSFPLLKRLIEVGDPKAKRAYKDEIAQRLESNDLIITKYLIDQNYLKDLSEDEIETILENMKPGVGKLFLNAWVISDRSAKFKDLFDDKKMSFRLERENIFLSDLNRDLFPYKDYKRAFPIDRIERYSQYSHNNLFIDFGIRWEKQRVLFRVSDIDFVKNFFKTGPIMVQIPRGKAPLKVYVKQENLAIYLYPELMY